MLEVVEANLEDVKKMCTCEVDKTVKIDRAPIEKAIAVRDGDEQFLIAFGKDPIVEVDFRGRYIDYYFERGIKTSVDEDVLKVAMKAMKMLYKTLRMFSIFCSKYRDEIYDPVEVYGYTEPNTEVHMQINYIPEYNLYFCDFDTLYTLGKGRVKDYSHFNKFYADRRSVEILETAIELAETLSVIV